MVTVFYYSSADDVSSNKVVSTSVLFLGRMQIGKKYILTF